MSIRQTQSAKEDAQYQYFSDDTMKIHIPAYLYAILTVSAMLIQLGIPGKGIAADSGVKEIIVVFKTHFDIGYTDLPGNVIDWYRTAMMDKALEVCDRSVSLPPENRFVWTLPGWPLYQILWPGQDAKRRQRILGALRDRQFVPHGLPFTTHTESLEAEDLVRGLGFSTEVSGLAGIEPPRDAKMTDVPSHSWILPTLLRNAGIDFLHLGCNSACTSPGIPMLFWWEGPDGSRLLTMYSANYGSELEPPAGWNHGVWLALIHTGDNQGPPAPDDIHKLLKEAGDKMPGAKIRFGSLSDFADALPAENPDLPVVRGDMPDTWIHGIMSMPQETGTARSVRPMIGMLESAATLLKLWGAPEEDIAGDIGAAYENSLLFGEHTWGMDVKHFGKRLYGTEWQSARKSGKYEKLEKSWSDKAGYISRMEAIVVPGLEEKMNELASAVAVKSGGLTVFNPLPYERDGVVALHEDISMEFVQDVETGMVIPAEKTPDGMRFIAENIPPMGYRTYIPVKPESPNSYDDLSFDPETKTVGNAFYKVVVSPEKGGIVSIIDKMTGRELVDSSGGFSLGQYVYERFDRANVDAYLDAYLKTRPGWAFDDLGKPELPPGKYSMQAAANLRLLALEKGPIAASAVMEKQKDGEFPHNFRLSVFLYADQPYIDIVWEIIGKDAQPLPEAGWLAFPLRAENPSYYLGRLGGVVNPAMDIIPLSNHDIYCLNSGVSVVSQDNSGVALISPDAPLISLGSPRLWQFTKSFRTPGPAIWVNLFNNQWSTNFKQWIEGSWKTRVRLWSSANYEKHGTLINPALEARYELQTGVASGRSGKLPPVQAGPAVSRKGVVVTAFGRQPGLDGILLRVWEEAGADGLCTITFPEMFDFHAAQPCDLRGRKTGNAVPVNRGNLTFQLKPYSPATFIIE